MYTSSRPATASTGRTALALVAIFTLLLSLFAIAGPAIAYHTGDGNEGPEVTPTAEDFPGGGPDCPDGSIGVRFGDSADDDAPLAEGEEVTVTFTDGSSATVTIISLADDMLTFEVEGGLAAIVFVKGGTDGQNVYDYTGFAGGGIAHDDGLITPTGQGISHIDFCLIPAPTGSILIYKDDQTGAPVGGATFSVKNDADEEVGTITTDDAGFGCLGELLFGDYTVTETLAPDGWLPDPDTEAVTVDTESTCADRLLDPTVGDADATFTNTLLGSLLVRKTDGTEPLDGAEFSIADSGGNPVNGTFTSGDDGAGVFCVDGLVFGAEYTVTETAVPAGGYTADPANPKTHVIDITDDCATRLAATEVVPDLTFVNTLERTGSITVVKEVECEDCETRTIGYYFNTADQHEEETNALFEELGGIWADGILFTNVDQVQQYRADDQDGTSDGENGLSARGQLTLQYLAAQLNVARNGEDCDLANRVYNNAESPFDGWTVQQILDEADAAFAEESLYSDEEIKSALDDINNSSHEEENPLSCGGSESGTLDGVTFDLFTQADFESDPQGEPIDSQTTADGGVAFFGELTIGETYVLVESGFPEGVTCQIVGVEGGDAEVIDGVVYVTLTEESLDENLNLTLTVANDCEEGEEEEEFGEIEIRKSAADDPDEEFFFSATWENGEFTLFDGDAEFSGDLPAGEEFTVTETLTEAQVAAGWSLDNIECGEAEVAVDGNSVTITVVADATIICTFTNVLEEEEEGILEIDKFFCTSDEDGTQFIVSDPAPLEDLSVLGVEEEDQEGCHRGDATFTIEKSTGELWEGVSVGDGGQIEIDLPPGDYTITETSTDEDPAPSATFTIEDGAITAVIVINFEGEEEEEGQIKIIKLFCSADEDSVTFTIEDGDQLPPSLEDCELGDASFKLNDGETFTIGGDGILFAHVEVGTYTLSEVLPNQATSPSFEVVLDEITTIIVVNNEGDNEGTGGGNPGGNEGTLGGNPLPNTAMETGATGTVPAALLALLMLSGLGAAGYAARAEARRRR